MIALSCLMQYPFNNYPLFNYVSNKFGSSNNFEYFKMTFSAVFTDQICMVAKMRNQHQ